MNLLYYYQCYLLFLADLIVRQVHISLLPYLLHLRTLFLYPASQHYSSVLSLVLLVVIRSLYSPLDWQIFELFY